MATRIFIQNPDSGEPRCLCGTVGDGREELAKAIGYLTLAEIEGLLRGEKQLRLVVDLIEMSDEEVAALPEL